MERFQYPDAIDRLRKRMLRCAKLVFKLPSLQASQETSAGDSKLKEFIPSFATFSSNGSYLLIGPSSKFQEQNPLPLQQ
ncbi:hypothetical protein Pyn_09043 [Prunus yedoensis var. nudiflora]|uniref:Uncharacterized protein n=1 Tax=Prunus yedoensis var. nudiflora TaxID=2094558 RepID=A0A314XZQ2_PRUYE|nr:hypothetical protein Pyn_09043 [Prunus yedoensis var. nudiflora]